MELEYNGISYLIQQDLYECNDLFYKRIWFISKNQPKNKQELNELINYSLFWKNIKYYGCIYNTKIMDKLCILEKSLY